MEITLLTLQNYKATAKNRCKTGLDKSEICSTTSTI